MTRSYLPTEQSTKLYDKAVAAISAVFSDDSVVPGVARDQLKELKGEINIFLEALDNDERNISLDYDPESEEDT